MPFVVSVALVGIIVLAANGVPLVAFLVAVGLLLWIGGAVWMEGIAKRNGRDARLALMLGLGLVFGPLFGLLAALLGPPEEGRGKSR